MKTKDIVPSIRVIITSIEKAKPLIRWIWLGSRHGCATVMYRAKYITPDGIQWRTIRADDINHASRIADKKAAAYKKWITISVTQWEDGMN